MWHLKVHNLTLTKKNCSFNIYQTINPIITPYIFSCKYLLANLWIALNMWLIKKSMQKIKILNVKWIFKDKTLQQWCHLNLLKIKIKYIKKVSIHFSKKFFIWWCFILFLLTFIFTFFWIHIFHFYCVIDVVLSFQKSITNP